VGIILNFMKPIVFKDPVRSNFLRSLRSDPPAKCGENGYCKERGYYIFLFLHERKKKREDKKVVLRPNKRHSHSIR